MALTFNKGALSAGIKHGYRSGLEERVAEDYIDHGCPARFEPIKIKYEIKRSTTYTPDFVQNNGIVIETKGRFMSKDRSKHLMLKKQYPNLEIRFVFSNPKARLNKRSNTTYGDWCDKHGFKYAAKLVPNTWMEEPVVTASYETLREIGYDFGDTDG